MNSVEKGRARAIAKHVPKPRYVLTRRKKMGVDAKTHALTAEHALPGSGEFVSPTAAFGWIQAHGEHDYVHVIRAKDTAGTYVQSYQSVG